MSYLMKIIDPPCPRSKRMSAVIESAIAWREARKAACASAAVSGAKGDPAVWSALGTAETALNDAVRALVEAQ